MKHLLPILAMISLSFLNPFNSARAKDNRGHVLTDLWKSYETAVRNDRPKEQLSILNDIKTAARKQNLAWDFYDACFKYAEAAGIRNWKDYEKEIGNRNSDITGFPAAIASYQLWVTNGLKDRDEIFSFIQTRKSDLLKGHNDEFWKRGFFGGHVYTDIIIDNISNDYEYALLSLYFSGDPGAEDSRINSECLNQFRGAYPLGAIAEYAATVEHAKETGKKDAAGRFMAAYQGKAVSLLASQDILLMRWNELKKDKEQTEDRYKALDRDCAKFIENKKQFQGKEKDLAECCTVADKIHEELNSKRAGYDIKDGVLTVSMRNLDKIHLTIQKYKGKAKVYEKTFENGKGSFYVIDKVKAQLPAFDDDNYEIIIKADGIDGLTGSYNKTTLSTSLKRDRNGWYLFAADHITGEPVASVDLAVSYKDRNVKEYKGMILDGFTRLPKDISDELVKGERTLLVSYRDKDGILHKSPEQWVYGRRYETKVNEDEMNCLILTDRSAFTPDETVHFKAVLFKGHYHFKAVTSTDVTAILKDAENHEISRQELKTNEFGSVAGEFVLQRAKRNGIYTIVVQEGGRTIATRGVTVDDFVLPTFTLSWDKDDREYEPGDTVEVKGNIIAFSGHNLGSAQCSYTVRRYGEMISEGTLIPDSAGNFEIGFTAGAENWTTYNVNVKVTDATGETLEFNRNVNVRKHEEVKPEEEKTYFFKDLKEEEPGSIATRIVAGDMTTWAVVEVLGPQEEILARQMLKFTPENGAPASTVVRYRYADNWPDVVTMNILYFQDSRLFMHENTVRRPDDSWKLPLRFTRFLDTTVPGATYTFTVRTEAGVECAATIFDKSTETIHTNTWRLISPNLIPAGNASYSSNNGYDESSIRIYDNIYIGTDWSSKYLDAVDDGMVVVGYGVQRKAVKSAARVTMANGMAEAPMLADAMDLAVEEEVEMAVAEDVPEQGYIRENFANTIAWEPFLRSDENGDISIRFTNADKLSTYYVQMFVHDPQMRNFTVRKEMKVTLPVKIAVVQPQLLYDGDRYVLKATLSNSTDAEVSGTFTASFLDGKDMDSAALIDSKTEKMSIPAHGAADFEFEYSVRNIKDLGMKLLFTADNSEYASDGVFVSIPVRKAVQEITEAHSAVLMSGGDREALIGKLRGQFVNISGEDASVREISIRRMLEEAVPELIAPKSENIVDLTEALFAQYLLDELKNGSATVDRESPVLAKIMKYKKEDGGFAWFDCFESSPVLTVLVMQRFAMMGLKDLCQDSATYLDDVMFKKKERPYWYGWISMQQYSYVRSLYSEVDFKTKGFDSVRWKAFKKHVKGYLVPRKTRGLNGELLAKARRLRTLQALGADSNGLSLAKAWGIRLGTSSRLAKSLEKDLASLVEYAVPHRNGGYYFPNAVMPWRGLIESEAYAHSMFCDLMDEMGYKDIADGVRLWLMLQKETQEWGDEPAYIEALNSVFHGSEELLATSVIALKATMEKPFEDIKASGNGFTVERAYYRDGELLKDGDELHVGDRIHATYTITSDENRSFVLLRAPRCAALRPVVQISGYDRGGYRSVLADRTEFWYETYPEEKTVRTEDFHVTQAGTFQSPVTEIICLYADHYRANDSGHPAVVCR